MPHTGAPCHLGTIERAAGLAGGTRERADFTVDQQTRTALKQDTYVTATSHGLEWAQQNRRSVIVSSAILLLIIVAVVVGGVLYTHRVEKASAAFGAAMQAYQTPLAQPGQPVPPGVKTYASVGERANAAGGLFTQVAQQYALTPVGKNALYFAGITYLEAARTARPRAR